MEDVVKVNNLEICTQEEFAKYLAYLRLKPEAEIIEKQFKNLTKEYMKENGIVEMENEYAKFRYVMPSKRRIVDTKKLEQDGLLEIYQKDSEVSDTVKVTMKWENM